MDAAAFFDLDRTVLAKSSTLAFGRPFLQGGLINRRAALKAAYAQLVFARGGVDAAAMDRIRDTMSALCAGWNVAQVREIVEEALVEIVDPLIFAEAADLIETHRAAGREVVIVSTSGTELVEPIGEMLGVDRVIATRMVTHDGAYTGEIDFYAYGPNKAAAIRGLAEASGYDLRRCFAYSDSITDLPMLEVVGNPTAVNPDRALRKVAERNGWPVIVFDRPVSLRRRSLPRPMITGTAIGLSAAAGAMWYASRRRGRT